MKKIYDGTKERLLFAKHIKKCKLDEDRIYIINTEYKDIAGNRIKENNKVKLIQQTDYMFIFETLDDKKLKECIYKTDYVVNKKIIKLCPGMSVKVC